MFAQELLSALVSQGDSGTILAAVSLVAILAQESPSSLPRKPKVPSRMQDDEVQTLDQWYRQWSVEREAWLSRSVPSRDL